MWDFQIFSHLPINTRPLQQAGGRRKKKKATRAPKFHLQQRKGSFVGISIKAPSYFKLKLKGRDQNSSFSYKLQAKRLLAWQIHLQQSCWSKNQRMHQILVRPRIISQPFQATYTSKRGQIRIKIKLYIATLGSQVYTIDRIRGIFYIFLVKVFSQRICNPHFTNQYKLTISPHFMFINF